VVSLAVPQFWLGTVLLIVFGVTLHLFPSGGYVAFGEDPEQWLRSMVLPWLTLAAAPAGLLARVVQIRVREQSALPHVVTATALGASRPRVVCSYVLRNSLSEPLTVIGIQCGYMIGGAFLVEQVFNLPGIGADAIHAAQQGDYPVVQAAALYAIVAFLIVSVVVDLSILGLDVRRQGRRQ
jgi:peptide/nickel transport system permease protein